MLERAQANQCLPSAICTMSSYPGTLRFVLLTLQVIDKLTERITDRLRSELKVELEASVWYTGVRIHKRTHTQTNIKQSRHTRTHTHTDTHRYATGPHTHTWPNSHIQIRYGHSYVGYVCVCVCVCVCVRAQRETRDMAAHATAHAMRQDAFLAKELENQNTCPICYELMVPPTRAPQLLFPCGKPSLCVYACSCVCRCVNVRVFAQAASSTRRDSVPMREEELRGVASCPQTLSVYVFRHSKLHPHPHTHTNKSRL